MYSPVKESPTELPPVGEMKVELATVKRKRAGRFIPSMPLSWFQRACRLPGKAALVAVVLWYRSRLVKANTFVLSQAALSEFGISRQAKYRALQVLEGAGLITVQRRLHRNPEVTILYCEEQGSHPSSLGTNLQPID
jgi:hypothetical protein